MNFPESYISGLPKNSRFPGVDGLERAKHFMQHLGNPQNKIKIIHIAGTSGKGSTAYLISHILHTLGFKTGLSLSPHVIDLRERCQVNNQLIDENLYSKYLKEIIPQIEKPTPYGPITYFEVLTGLAYYSFWREKVDYAVIETGLGGRLDATNTVTNDKLSVITRIGHDHNSTLGRNLTEIASQKAGIITGAAISIKQNSRIMKVLDPNNPLIVNPPKAKITQKGTEFRYRSKKYMTSLYGIYQAENSCLAMEVVRALAARDSFAYDNDRIRYALETAHFTGRFDVRSNMILDGAHNPQKMKCFIKSLKMLFPGRHNFLLAFKRKKKWKHMLNYIIPVADSITLTGFKISQDGRMGSEDPFEIQEYLAQKNIPSTVILNSESALENAMSKPGKTIVTGSLYLLADIYPLIDSNSQLLAADKSDKRYLGNLTH